MSSITKMVLYMSGGDDVAMARLNSTYPGAQNSGVIMVAALLALAVGLGGVVYSLVQQRQAQVAQITLESAPGSVSTVAPGTIEECVTVTTAS